MNARNVGGTCIQKGCKGTEIFMLKALNTKGRFEDESLHLQGEKNRRREGIEYLRFRSEYSVIFEIIITPERAKRAGV